MKLRTTKENPNPPPFSMPQQDRADFVSDKKKMRVIDVRTSDVKWDLDTHGFTIGVPPPHDTFMNFAEPHADLLMLNIWHPRLHPAFKRPLALLDWTSVKASDTYHPVEITYLDMYKHLLPDMTEHSKTYFKEHSGDGSTANTLKGRFYVSKDGN